MRIKEIISQHRRDFRAIFQCEHCNAEYEMDGYDDANFHNNVIPQFKCRECGVRSFFFWPIKKAADNYRPRLSMIDFEQWHEKQTQYEPYQSERCPHYEWEKLAWNAAIEAAMLAVENADDDDYGHAPNNNAYEAVEKLKAL